MLAAIVNPGPSLARFPQGLFIHYDIAVAVNRGVVAGWVNWWAMGDEHAFIRETPMNPAVQIFASSEVDRRLREHADGDVRARYTKRKITLYESLFDQAPSSLSWGTFTMPAAIVLAAMKGAKEIHLYGNDRTQAPDFDGVNYAENIRTADRWEHEAIVLKSVTEWATGRGISIHRIRVEAVQ
jgi:hypothetical protein